ncbi:MAG: hypothetical protein ACLUVG_06910 [Phocaeicola vulgatus]
MKGASEEISQDGRITGSSLQREKYLLYEYSSKVLRITTQSTQSRIYQLCICQPHHKRLQISHPWNCLSKPAHFLII